MGATMSSETTAAAAGEVGQLRFDPMAMLPFCGYNMADYFGHWLKIGEREGAKLPRIFYVNWFRKDADGKFLWPGFGENSRVLEWIFRRCEGKAEAVETPIGLVPTAGALDTEGLDISDEDVAELLSVDPPSGRRELPQMHQHFARFGEQLPAELHDQLEDLEARAWAEWPATPRRGLQPVGLGQLRVLLRPASRPARPSPCTASRWRRPASCRRSCGRRGRRGSPRGPSSRTGPPPAAG